MSEVQIPRGPNSTLRAYVATPTTGPGPWPAVVVIHDVLGFTSDVCSHADRLAAAGYVAAAPDLYDRGGALRCIRATFRSLSEGQGAAFDDIDAVRRWLAERDDCTGRVGVIGFCLGGGFALLCSTRGFHVSAPNYGFIRGNLDALLRGACPIVASYGAKDRIAELKNAAAKLEATLQASGVPHDVKEYPDAAHSFMNQHVHGPVQAFMRVIGFGFHAPSADDAWRRILAFFEQHLRTPETRDAAMHR